MNSYLFYYGLTAMAILISGAAQAYIMYMYNSNSKIDSVKKISGLETARMILDKHGLHNVNIEMVRGTLSDHYDPRKKVVRLSTSIYKDSSISSIAVSAHECGHAIQDKEGYAFMRFRSSLVPLVNICSYAGYIAIMIGLLAGLLKIVVIGIILECVILLFQFITLPVEIDASRRALRELQDMNILDVKEHKRAKNVLRAAALTYVASVLSTLLQILRLVLMLTRRRN